MFWKSRSPGPPQTDPPSPLRQNPTYREIWGRVDYHIGLTRWQSGFYHHFAFVLQWLTPLAAASVPVFTRPGTEALSYLALFVTVLTVLNSAIHPFERAMFAKRFSNKLWEFRLDLERRMEEVEAIADPDTQKARFFALLKDANNKVADIIDQFNEGPEFPAFATNGTHGQTGSGRRDPATPDRRKNQRPSSTPRRVSDRKVPVPALKNAPPPLAQGDTPALVG